MKSSALMRSLAAALSLFSASAFAQEAPDDTDVIKQALETFLSEKAMELLSKKTDSLQLKYIEPSSTNDQPGWGVDYSWKASKETASDAAPKDGESFVIKRMSYELAIDGSYAFADAKNNQDLSTVTAALKLTRGDFGKIHFLPGEKSLAAQKCVQAIPFPTTNEEQALYDRADALCAQANGIDRLVKKDAQRSYYYWLDFHGGVEANQNYSQTHTLFGLAGAFAYQPDPSHAHYNIFDTPFRWLRSAFSEHDYVAPFPSLLLGVDRLDADTNDPRSALTTDTTFTRAKAEVAFATQLANVSGQIVRLTTSFRYFKELGAPQSVKDANLDEFHFFTASLRTPARMLPLIESDAYELFVSYTDGKLPFGVANDQTYEIGISTNIQALANFLAK